MPSTEVHPSAPPSAPASLPASSAIDLDPIRARPSLDEREDSTRERAFTSEVDDLFRRRLRVASAVLLVLHVAGFLVFEDPSHSRVGYALRLGLIPFTGVIFASTWRRALAAWSRPLAALMIVSTAGYAAFTNVSVGTPLDIRALSLTVLTAGLLFPFSAWAMLAMSVAVVGMYVAAGASVGQLVATEFGGGVFFLAGAAGIGTTAALLSSRLRKREFDARRSLVTANEQNEALLRNMLPAAIVARLKARPGAVADRYAEATVMFVDIVGFTVMSSALTPESLVSFLNKLFSRLDELTTSHGLEKIKTIGDAYMVAGGLPEPRADHAEAVARLALDVRALVTATKTPNGSRLSVRIGIHSGPVVAGVIGATKLTYDLWGDTVNTASRMESHGEPGMIQVSEATYARLVGLFELEPRGSLSVKGKGEMKAYALVGPRAPGDGASASSPSGAEERPS